MEVTLHFRNVEKDGHADSDHPYDVVRIEVKEGFDIKLPCLYRTHIDLHATHTSVEPTEGEVS